MIEDAEAEEEPTARGRRKRRDSATLRGDKLTEEQITQVGSSLWGHKAWNSTPDPTIKVLSAVPLMPILATASLFGSITLIQGVYRATRLQIHERIAQELDPDGAGLSYSDFESITSRMPDFFVNFKMSV